VFQKAGTLLHNDIHLENIIQNETGDLIFIDIDWMGFGIPCFEIRKIFMFCFFPMEMCALSLRDYYQTTYPEIFLEIIKAYPDLWPKKYNAEILLQIASEIIPKLADTQYSHLALQAHNFFFERYIIEELI
jgi:hypothetical protein